MKVYTRENSAANVTVLLYYTILTVLSLQTLAFTAMLGDPRTCSHKYRAGIISKLGCFHPVLQ